MNYKQQLTEAGFTFVGNVGCGPCGSKKEKWTKGAVSIFVKGNNFWKQQYGVKIPHHINKLQTVLNELV